MPCLTQQVSGEAAVWLQSLISHRVVKEGPLSCSLLSSVQSGNSDMLDYLGTISNGPTYDRDLGRKSQS